MNGARVALSGTAVVVCVHGREKREVTTEAEVAEVGLVLGIVYNPKQHKIHKCACCENLFVDPTDIPRYCRPCQRAAVHPIGGPMPEPIGEV